MDKKRVRELEVTAMKIRKNALTGIYHASSGHPGGSLSIADVLSVLYFEIMNVDPKNPKDENRDRFVLSKGHCAPALYGALAERGFFPVSDCSTLRKIDSYLQGHPDMKAIPGVDMSTGSLGQGISAANGIALAGKLDKKDYHVYTILGDGELQEGQVWEATMFAAHYHLDNLTAFVDLNGLQIDGKITDVMSPLPVDEKFKAFNWHVINVNGHNVEELYNAICEAKTVKEKPSVIIMKTIKGKGISYMENEASWHGTAPKEDDYIKGLAEIDAKIKELEGAL